MERATPSPDQRALPPEVVDALATRYRFDAPIGRGASGTVWRAIRRDDARVVAIKIIPFHGDDPIGRQRAAREQQILRTLAHPAIVPLLDHGNTATAAWLVTPCYAWTLADRMRARRWSVREVAGLLHALATALETVHRAGVVHRDVKPANIFLDTEDAPRLGDFGIVTGDEARLTQTGRLMGSLAYASPEQLLGARLLDARADQYALGVVGYELLSGRLPHDGPTVESHLARVLTEPVVPLRTLRPEIPVALADAIHRALERHPRDRWTQVGDFGRVCDTVARGDEMSPVSVLAEQAPRDGGGDDRRRPVMRHAAPVLMVVLAGVAASLLAPRHAVLTLAVVGAALLGVSAILDHRWMAAAPHPTVPRRLAAPGAAISATAAHGPTAGQRFRAEHRALVTLVLRLPAAQRAEHAATVHAADLCAARAATDPFADLDALADEMAALRTRLETPTSRAA